MRLMTKRTQESRLYRYNASSPKKPPRSSGRWRRRRRRDCTIVQVERELKGKLIPGELRECGEGMLSRYKSKMRKMVHAQGSAARTYEADDETYSGKVPLSVRCELSLGRAPQRGERASKGKGGLWPLGFHPCPFRPFGPTKPP